MDTGKTKKCHSLTLSPKMLEKMAIFAAKNQYTEAEMLHALLTEKYTHYIEKMFDYLDLDTLPKKDADILWRKLSRENRILMCKNLTFCENLSKKQCDNILEENDQEIIMSVIRSLPSKIEHFNRLEEQDAKAFLTQLRRHPNLAIRKELFNEDIMEEMPEYSINECIELGEIKICHLNKLKSSDIVNIEKLCPKLLIFIAKNAEHITNKSVLLFLAQTLINNDDNYYAVVLAENKKISSDLLKILEEYGNQYISSVARRTLDSLVEDDDDDENDDYEDYGYYDIDNHIEDDDEDDDDDDDSNEDDDEDDDDDDDYDDDDEDDDSRK